MVLWCTGTRRHPILFVGYDNINLGFSTRSFRKRLEYLILYVSLSQISIILVSFQYNVRQQMKRR